MTTCTNRLLHPTLSLIVTYFCLLLDFGTTDLLFLEVTIGLLQKQKMYWTKMHGILLWDLVIYSMVLKFVFMGCLSAQFSSHKMIVSRHKAAELSLCCFYL